MPPANKRTVSVRPEHDPLLSRSWRYLRYGVSYLRYANQPIIWPAIYRKVTSKISGRIPGPQELRRMLEAGEAWCKPRIISTREGLHKLGIADMLNVREKYADIFLASKERAGNIPVWMGGGSNLDLLYTICQARQPRMIVETGVAHGWSSLAFLLYLKEQGNGALHSVDLPLLELHNDRYVGVAVPNDLKSAWHLYRMADREGLPRIIKSHPQIDLAYYDSDKSEDGRAFAYNLLWNALRPGGVLISDDISDNMAFAQFCEENNVDPIVVAEPGCNPQGILIKP